MLRLPGSSVQAADAAEAAQRVREAKDAGYDFIKTHQPITPEAYLAAIAEGRRLGIPVLGHVSPEVGVARSIEAGYATGEHFKGYDPRGPDPLLERLTVESGFRNCPTLVAMWTNAQQDALLADPLPEMRYLPPPILGRSSGGGRRTVGDTTDAITEGESRGAEVEILKRPVENLTLGINHSLTNADPLFAPNPYIVGNPLTPVLPLYAPENAGSASIDRVLPLEGGVDVRESGGIPVGGWSALPRRSMTGHLTSLRCRSRPSSRLRPP